MNEKTGKYLVLASMVLLAGTGIFMTYTATQCSRYLDSCTQELEKVYVDCYGGIPYGEFNYSNYLEDNLTRYQDTW